MPVEVCPPWWENMTNFFLMRSFHRLFRQAGHLNSQIDSRILSSIICQCRKWLFFRGWRQVKRAWWVCIWNRRRSLVRNRLVCIVDRGRALLPYLLRSLRGRFWSVQPQKAHNLQWGGSHRCILQYCPRWRYPACIGCNQHICSRLQSYRDRHYKVWRGGWFYLICPCRSFHTAA